MKAVRIHAHGEPDLMRWEDVELPPPGAGEVRVRHSAIAFNFSDVNVRRGGFYLAAPVRFPLILGNEAAGVVTELGPGVTRVRRGARVAYVGAGGPFYENTGAYAEERNLPDSCLIPLPDAIDDRQAAAMMLKGLTASMVVNRCYRPKPGDTILIHGAASGVGLILCQWAKHLGATVIGTVGSRDKAGIAASHGCDHPLLYEGFVAAVKKIAPVGVSAVFDGVGKDTFLPSLDCTRPFGMLVNYGNTSGHVPPVDLILLSKKGSLAMSRPGISTYLGVPGVMEQACAELFELVTRGAIRIEIGKTYPLRDAASAHRDLEARRNYGSVVLLP